MEAILCQLKPELFAGIREEDLGGMLTCTGYHVTEYQKGQIISMEDEQIRHVGIVLKGKVDMVKTDIWGNRTMLSREGQGQMFGEIFACSEDTRAMVSFVAAEESRVLFIPFHKVMHTCSMACEFHQRLVENMVRIIAAKGRDLMRKVEVVSKKTLREKILTYLSQQAQLQDSRYFSVPLSRQEMAEYLCADRSALSRELAGMRSDGLIDFDKNMFKIL